GRALYTTLEKILKAMNIKNVNACIAAPEKEDEYLTNDSILFHERMGYTLAGTFHQCGSKFGRWYNMVWMEKLIAAHEENPAPVLPFCAVQEQFFPKK
ncbi:MAG: GNAT family N-acetyltransferase, partial [Treponema porcinum]|uniref:GNAT family N-acetyltransferase n=1 Tax=Treponema porcinum TaxID=261392 RepID=UPI002A812122